MQAIQELLQTSIGTQGQLLIPRKIYSRLIEAVDKALIPRSEAAIYAGPGEIPGTSLDVDTINPDSLAVRQVGEGAEVPLDATEFTSFNMKPIKYGVAIRITREMLEDSQFNVLDRSVMMAGKEFAENENSLIISNALDNATNTVTGGGAITIANITRAMQYLEDADYAPTTLFVGIEVLNDLRNIDTFAEADKFGNRDMLERGFAGVLYGMNVIKVSTNAGMTTTTAYITDRDHAYIIAEKRGITLEGFELPTHDMSGTVATQRIAVRQIRADAIAKITTT